MKILVFTIASLLTTIAHAQNVAFSCVSKDFEVSGVIIEDARGYTFEVRELRLEVQGFPPALENLTGSSISIPEGRFITFTLPNKQKVEVTLFDNGDTDYSFARGLISMGGWTLQETRLECAAASAP